MREWICPYCGGRYPESWLTLKHSTPRVPESLAERVDCAYEPILFIEEVASMIEGERMEAERLAELREREDADPDPCLRVLGACPVCGVEADTFGCPRCFERKHLEELREREACGYDGEAPYFQNMNQPFSPEEIFALRRIVREDSARAEVKAEQYPAERKCPDCHRIIPKTNIEGDHVCVAPDASQKPIYTPVPPLSEEVLGACPVCGVEADTFGCPRCFERKHLEELREREACGYDGEAPYFEANREPLYSYKIDQAVWDSEKIVIKKTHPLFSRTREHLEKYDERTDFAGKGVDRESIIIHPGHPLYLGIKRLLKDVVKSVNDPCFVVGNLPDFESKKIEYAKLREKDE